MISTRVSDRPSTTAPCQRRSTLGIQRRFAIGAGGVVERYAALVEGIAFPIAISFDPMGHRGGPLARVIASAAPSRRDWATVLEAAALSHPALSAGTRLHPSQATAPPRFAAGQPAPAARAARTSRRARIDSALSH